MSFPEYLIPEFLIGTAPECGVSDQLPELLSAAETARGSTELTRCLSAMMQELRFPAIELGFDDWQFPPGTPPELQDLLNLLVVLGTAPYARAAYAARGIPENITAVSLRRLESVCRDHTAMTGRKGIPLSAVAWQRNYFRDPLIYSLGRFNYRLIAPRRIGVFLKRRSDGRRVLLAGDGWNLNSAGLFALETEPAVLVTQLTEDENGWTGCPVDVYGTVRLQPASFSKAEYEVILRGGDLMIDMHIPGGGGMTIERCLDSFRQAFAFFDRYYPDKYRRVVYCSSWIFNPAFEKELPESNMAKLMREVWLFPEPSTGKDGWRFLFGSNQVDTARAPRDTSLRRAMLNILERGEPLRQGGMFLPEEDLACFGTGCSRRLAELLA